VIHAILTGLGLVAVIEGLVLALAPLRFEELLKTFQEMPVQTRRTLGLGMVALGVFVVWLAKFAGA